MSKVFKAVGKAISGVAKAVVNVVSGVVKAVGKVVSSVINFVTQPFMGLLGGIPNAPSAAAEADRQQGVLVQTQGSDISIPVVYGYRKVGGAVVFAETGSTNNKYLYVAYVFSEGVVEGLREVFIDDWQLPVNLTANLNAGQVVDVNADRYNGRVRLQWYPGVYFSNVSQSPVGASVKSGIFAEAPSFKDTMDFNGLAVLFARYEWKDIKTQEDADNNPFSGNIPQVQISMLGRRVASLLVDAEDFTYDSAPVRYSTNPAEILLDYLRNPRYGKGLLNTDIDWSSWKRSARKCNTTVTYLTTTSDITGPILTCNFVLDTSQTIMSNTKTLLMGFRAYMPYVQGKYKLRIEDAGNLNDILSGQATIVATFNKDNIVGDITYSGIEKSAKYNVVAITYVDPDQKFSNQQVIYPETQAERQVYIDLDGGRENKLDATFPTLTNYAMAKDMARLLFNKSRRQETCNLRVSGQGLELEPGDTIRIQSNILNFGTDPWRIVSFSVNDDMTIDLGCVRNPDDIYPYARAGEEDIVLPTFVPKGSVIYFPGSSNEQLLGLVPPINAVYPSDFITSTTNPGATNPQLIAGGGVGGGNPEAGPIPVAPDPTPEEPTPVAPPQVPVVPVPPVNNNPTPVPPPVIFSGRLTFKSVTAVPESGAYRFNIIFTQPTDALYDHAIFWWRLNQYSPWNSIRLDNRPGAGGDIPVSIGPLPIYGQYDYYVRAFASNGDASSVVTRGFVKVIEDQSARVGGIFVGTGGAVYESVSEGWALPAGQVSTTPKYDDNIDVLSIRPKLTAGLPQDPRKLTVTFNQIEYSYVTAANPLIDGVRIYYKYRDDTYYTVEDFKFANLGQYFPGQVISFDLAGDFGARVFPADASFSPTAFQSYDFIIRLTYSDGTPAQKQMGPVRAPVERFNGLYDYVAVGTVATAAGKVSSTAIPAGFTILTTDQDPNRLFPSGSDIIPSIQSMSAAPSTSRITWVFNPPTSSRFRGYTIRFREIAPGANPAYNEVSVGSVTDLNTGKIIFNLEGNGYNHSAKYEWVVSARYAPPGGGASIDATNCLYTRASVPFNVPSGTNLVNNYFNFEEKNTKLALGELVTAFPAVPTIVPHAWIKRQNLRLVTTDTKFVAAAGGNDPSADIYAYTGSNIRINRYYKLRFQTPNNTWDNLVVYRRVYSAAGLARTTTGSQARYNGLGAWERVVIPRTDLFLDETTGLYTVNLRGPLSQTLFNPLYQVPGNSSAGLFATYYGAAPNKFGPGPFLNDIYPYYGTGNNASSGIHSAEFLFVIDDDGESPKACRLTEFFAESRFDAFKTEVDGLIAANVPKDNIVNTADYNGLVAGYLRNLNEAITAIPLSGLSGLDLWGRGVPRLTNFTTWTGLLAQPVGGDTVY